MTRKSLRKLENELKSIEKLEPGDRDWETILQMTGFSSSGIETEVGCVDDQISGGSRSQSGPFHQSECWSRVLGIIPREAQSAGFSGDHTCLQLLAGVRSEIVEIRFATKVLSLRGPPYNQLRTMVESVQ